MLAVACAGCVFSHISKSHVFKLYVTVVYRYNIEEANKRFNLVFN